MILLLSTALAAIAPAPIQAGQVRVTGSTYRCLIQQDRDESERLANSMPDSREGQIAFEKLLALHPGCFKSVGTTQPIAKPLGLAAGLAGALYLQHVVSRKVRWNSPEDRVGAIQAVATNTETWPAGAAAAECLIVREPLAADNLVRSRPASKQEKPLLDALAGLLPSCLLKGRALSITREDLRSQVILAAYRRSWGSIVKFLDSGRPLGFSIPRLDKGTR